MNNSLYENGIAGILLAYCTIVGWYIIHILLVYCCHIVGLLSANCWPTVGILLAYWKLLLTYCWHCIPWVAAQVVRWSGLTVEACSSPGWCNKSSDFQAALTPCNTYVELWGHCLWGWGVRPVKCIYRSGAIVRSWLWSTATKSFPFCYFSNYCK